MDHGFVARAGMADTLYISGPLQNPGLGGAHLHSCSGENPRPSSPKPPRSAPSDEHHTHNGNNGNNTEREAGQGTVSTNRRDSTEHSGPRHRQRWGSLGLLCYSPCPILPACYPSSSLSRAPSPTWLFGPLSPTSPSTCTFSSPLIPYRPSASFTHQQPRVPYAISLSSIESPVIPGCHQSQSCDGLGHSWRHVKLVFDCAITAYTGAK